MARLRLLAVLTVAAAIATPTYAEPRFSFEATPCCLPKDVRPLTYRLDIKPDLDKLAAANGKEDVEFTGEEEIDIEVLNATDVIILNAVDITFRKVALDGTAAKKVIADAGHQTAAIHLANRIATGRHKLTISFSGKIIPQPHGIITLITKR